MKTNTPNLAVPCDARTSFISFKPMACVVLIITSKGMGKIERRLEAISIVDLLFCWCVCVCVCVFDFADFLRSKSKKRNVETPSIDLFSYRMNDRTSLKHFTSVVEWYKATCHRWNALLAIACPFSSIRLIFDLIFDLINRVHFLKNHYSKEVYRFDFLEFWFF